MSDEQLLTAEEATAQLSANAIQHTLEESGGCLIAATMRRDELLKLMAEPECKITAAAERWAEMGYRITIQSPGRKPLHVHATSEVRW